MRTKNNLVAKTAADLMSRELVTLTETTSVREAVRLLLRNQFGGAPVVDSDGRCVGVFSLIDSLRHCQSERKAQTSLPLSCSYLKPHVTAAGQSAMLCTLPYGACPLQERTSDVDGKEMIACTQPHCVLIDWQVVDTEKLSNDAIRNFMTKDVATMGVTTPIRKLARAMIDADIHRIIVVDDDRRPIGVVSSTDLLAALAYTRSESEPKPINQS